jgi:hypothetical protein
MSKLGATRSRALRAPCVLWAVLAASLAACGGDDEEGGGDLGACGQISGCGGDIVGTWNVDGACTDNAFALMGSAVEKPECKGLIVDTQTDGAGTFTFTASTLSSNVTISIDVTARYTPACVTAIANGAAVDFPAVCMSLTDQYAVMSSVSGASCAIAGGNCDCIISFDLPLSANTSYTKSGATIMSQGGSGPLTYCVAGDTLELGGRIGEASLLLNLSR